MADPQTGDAPVVTSQAELRRWLLAAVARRINGDPAALDPRERFSRYGVDSIKAAAITAELSEFLRRPLPRTLLWDNPSIDAVVRHLTSTTAAAPAPVQAAAPRPAAPRETAEPIAIVGLACRFPLRAGRVGVLAAAARRRRRDPRGAGRPLGCRALFDPDPPSPAR